MDAGTRWAQNTVGFNRRASLQRVKCMQCTIAFCPPCGEKKITDKQPRPGRSKAGMSVMQARAQAQCDNRMLILHAALPWLFLGVWLDAS